MYKINSKKKQSKDVVFGVVQFLKDGIWYPVASSTKLRLLLNDTLWLLTLKEFSKHFVPFQVYKRSDISFRLILIDNRFRFRSSSMYRLLDIDYPDDLPDCNMFLRSMMCFNLV